MARCEKFGPQQIGDDTRIMQWPAIRAIFFHIKAFKKIQELGHGWPRVVFHPAEFFNPLLGGQSLMGAVERDQGHRNIGVKHQTRRMWINIDIELGSHSHIAAFEETTAHGDDLFDARCNARLLHQGKADIGEWPKRAQRHRSCRLGHQRFDDEIHTVLFLQRHFGFRQHRPIKPGAAVHVFGRHQRA